MTLNELIQSGRMLINPDEAADIFGCKPETLRNAIQNGTCPFAFEASRPGAHRKFYVVSVLAMVNWLTGSHYTALDEMTIAIQRMQT